MKKFFLIFILSVLISLPLTFAHGEEGFAQAEELIMDKVSCDELTEEQLELIGEYYMEQMHPDELHKIMDERMGGEGSESLRQAHINMALSFYCGEHQIFSQGMMNLMMGRNSNGMGPEMMNNGYGQSYIRSNIWGNLSVLLVLIGVALLIYNYSSRKKKRRKK